MTELWAVQISKGTNDSAVSLARKWTQSTDEHRVQTDNNNQSTPLKPKHQKGRKENERDTMREAEIRDT